MNLNIIQGDITTIHTDALVNAANKTLHHGGGVCGAIHVAAGPGLLAWTEWMYPHGTQTAVPVVSPAFDLPAKHVIHVPGPDARDRVLSPEEVEGAKCFDSLQAYYDALLWLSYARSLVLAGQIGSKTVTFPSLSTGIFGFPLDRAAPIALDALRTAADRAPSVDTVAIVAFDAETFAAFKRALRHHGGVCVERVESTNSTPTTWRHG